MSSRSEDADAKDAHAGFHSSRRIARNTLARSGGEIVAKLASIAFYVVMARELGADQFGSFIFGLSLASVVLVGAGFGMDILLTREVAEDEDRVDGLLADVMALKSGMLVALLGILAGIVLVGPYAPQTRIAVIVIGAGVAFEMMAQTIQAVCQAYERMDLGAWALAVQRVTTAGVGIAILLAGAGLIAAATVYLVGAILSYLISEALMRRHVVRPKRKLDRSRWLHLLKAGAPIGAVSLLFTMLLRLDASLLSFLTGGDQNQVGYYGAAYRLVDATMFISLAFSAAMLPWLSRQDDRDEILARGSTLGFKVLAAVLMPIGAAYAVFASDLISLIYGSHYGPATLPLRLLGVMTILYGVNWFASSLLIARRRPGSMARAMGVVLLLNVALNVVLIPPYGAPGAAAAAAASGLVLAAYGWRQVSGLVGGLEPTRAFGGPVIATAALCAVGLIPGLPLAVAAPLAVVAFCAVLGCFERLVYPDDLSLVAGMVRAGGSSRELEPVADLP